MDKDTQNSIRNACREFLNKIKEFFITFLILAAIFSFCLAVHQFVLYIGPTGLMIGFVVFVIAVIYGATLKERTE